MTFTRRGQFDLGELSTYEDMLSLMAPVFTGTSRESWNIIGQMTWIGKRFDPTSLRFYLCPANLSNEDLSSLSIIYACRSVSLGQVFREIKWGDWFSMISFMEVLTMVNEFGLLITPTEVPPWAYLDAFYTELHQLTVFISNPRRNILLHSLPEYLAEECLLHMLERESQPRGQLAEWLETHQSVFTGRLPKHWTVDITQVSACDMVAIKREGLKILAIADKVRDHVISKW
jgi:hypothetical protein